MTTDIHPEAVWVRDIPGQTKACLCWFAGAETLTACGKRHLTSPAQKPAYPSSTRCHGCRVAKMRAAKEHA